MVIGWFPTRRLWPRLPLTVRMMWVAGLFLASLPLWSLGWSTGWVVVIVATLTSWGVGAFRFKLIYALYMALNVLTVAWLAMYLVCTNRPVSELSPYVENFPQFSLFMLCALVGISGVTLAEWLQMARSVPWAGGLFSTVLAVVSTACNSWARGVGRAFDARRLALPSSWLAAKPRHTCQLVIDGVDLMETGTTMVVESVDFATAQLRKWRRSDSVAVAGIESAWTPDRVYELPWFPEIFGTVFGQACIAREWQKVLEQHVLGAGAKGRTLDLGAGTGRLALWLMARGVSVDCLEANAELAEMCERALAGQREHAIGTVINGRFPNVAGTDYDVVILHQNVFVELINGMALQDVANSLAAVVRPGGVLLLDYPTNLRVPSVGQFVRLVNTEVPTVGAVEYGYTYHGEDGSAHGVELQLKVEREPFVRTERRMLRITVPQLATVVTALRSAGFGEADSVETGAMSFFPCTMMILAMVMSKEGEASRR